MPVADPSFGWLEAAGAFGVVTVVAFAVTWIVTDLARVSRTPYIAVLTFTTLVLGVGYVAGRAPRSPISSLRTGAGASSEGSRR